jgi:hypothetical protein
MNDNALKEHMMSFKVLRQNELYDGEKISFKNIVQKFPWIVARNNKCILSPDSDGFLCGLLMSHFLDWEIVGYYDGKVMATKDGTNINDVIFLDMEIYRQGIKSVGHHMVLNNKNTIPNNWSNYDNCIQPNNILNYDARTNFRTKYPFGTIHFLLPVIKYIYPQLTVKNTAISSLLYTDGTFKNIFNYPENSLEWLSFLDAMEKENPLHKIFYDNDYSISSLMADLKDYFAFLNTLGTRADKLKISNTRGVPENLISDGSKFYISNQEKEKNIKFLKFLSNRTGWNFKESHWCYDNLKVYIFTKQITDRINNTIFTGITSSAFSWAITGTTTIEYTVEGPNHLADVS